MQRSPFTEALIASPDAGAFWSRLGITPGSVFFVDSGSSAAVDQAGYGKSWAKPFATLTYAISQCTDNAGDIIYMAPRHAESKTSTGNIVLADKAGVRIIGLRSGAKMPTFTLGHATATFSITGANVVLEGVKIISDVADCAVGLTMGAASDGSVIRGCWFTSGALTKELQIAISLAALASDIEIDRCLFETIATDETGSETHAILCAGAADRLYVHDCEAYGNFGTAAIAGTVAASVRVRILRNFLHNIDTTNGLAVSLHSSTTGIVSDNRLIGLKTNTVPLAAQGCSVFFNLTSAAVNESGLLKPDAETFS